MAYLTKFDEAVKSQKPDGFVERSSSRRANLSGVRRTQGTPQRLRDAAQRRNWPFKELKRQPPIPVGMAFFEDHSRF
jgi:hypothetical protein